MQTGGQTDGQIDILKNPTYSSNPFDRIMNRLTDRQTDGLADRQTDRRTDRQTYRQRDRQTYR